MSAPLNATPNDRRIAGHHITAIVSPTARPIPRMTPRQYADFSGGQLTFLMVAT
jgi:hypothetical protein